MNFRCADCGKIKTEKGEFCYQCRQKDVCMDTFKWIGVLVFFGLIALVPVAVGLMVKLR